VSEDFCIVDANDIQAACLSEMYCFVRFWDVLGYYCCLAFGAVTGDNGTARVKGEG
jgi:hypothetical protein